MFIRKKKLPLTLLLTRLTCQLVVVVTKLINALDLQPGPVPAHRCSCMRSLSGQKQQQQPEQQLVWEKRTIKTYLNANWEFHNVKRQTLRCTPSDARMTHLHKRVASFEWLQWVQWICNASNNSKWPHTHTHTQAHAIAARQVYKTKLVANKKENVEKKAKNYIKALKRY